MTHCSSGSISAALEWLWLSSALGTSLRDPSSPFPSPAAPSHLQCRSHVPCQCPCSPLVNEALHLFVAEPPGRSRCRQHLLWIFTCCLKGTERCPLAVSAEHGPLVVGGVYWWQVRRG